MVLKRFAAAIQIITTEDGIPVQFDIFCGETGDITAFQCTQINRAANRLDEGSKLIWRQSL